MTTVRLPRASSRGRLGCGVNTAYITWKCGQPRMCSLPGAVDITWSRTLDNISECEVVINLSGVEDICCECLGNLEPWCHEIHIVRDTDDGVWIGPITEIIYEFNKVTIRALDALGWTTVRYNELDLNYVATELTDIAKDILAVAYAEDDTCFYQYISTTPTGMIGDRAFPRYTDSAFDQLDVLAQAGLNYTVVGRTIVLGPEDIPTAPIASLTDEMILGDITFTKDGKKQGTRWFVHFDGDVGDPAVAEAADINTVCYGVIERTLTTDIALSNVTDAQATAQIYVDATKVAPRIIEVPDGSRLSPETPWIINDMIPGARVDVALTRLCVGATQSFRLIGMQCRQSAEGEEITITLSPLNVLGTEL